MNMFNPNGNYHLEFEQYVTHLVEHLKYLKSNKLPIPTLDERNQAATELIENYINLIGKRPQNYQLSRLSDYILYEVLSDNRSNKSSIEEYPVLSDQQYMRRVRKENSFEFYEGSLNSDGKNMTLPHRKSNRQAYMQYFNHESKDVKE